MISAMSPEKGSYSIQQYRKKYVRPSTQMRNLADSDGPDQTAHMRSLIRAVTVRICPEISFSQRDSYLYTCNLHVIPEKRLYTVYYMYTHTYRFNKEKQYSPFEL